MKTWYSPIGSKVYITQWFGERPSAYKQFGLKGHNGIDYRVKFSDSPRGRRYVYALSDGVVMWAKTNGGYGKEIRLRLTTGEEVNYGHLHSFKVNTGDTVKGGQVIGLTNNSRFSSGAHLHFGIRPKDYNAHNGYAGWLNPMKHGYLENGLIDPETNRVLAWRGRVMETVKIPIPNEGKIQKLEAELKQKDQYIIEAVEILEQAIKNLKAAQ